MRCVKFRARKGAVPAQIRGQHTPGGRLDGRRRRDPGRARGAHLRQALLDPGPCQLRPPTAISSAGESGLLYASAERKLPPERQIAEHPGHRPPVHLAVRLPGRERTRRPRRALLLRGDGRPHEHDRHPGHRLRGRRALLVDPRTRRQVPGRARLPQLHVVQDRQGRGSTAASAPPSAAAATRA